jgi:hypothetical protein
MVRKMKKEIEEEKKKTTRANEEIRRINNQKIKMLKKEIQKEKKETARCQQEIQRLSSNLREEQKRNRLIAEHKKVHDMVNLLTTKLEELKKVHRGTVEELEREKLHVLHLEHKSRRDDIHLSDLQKRLEEQKELQSNLARKMRENQALQDQLRETQLFCLERRAAHVRLELRENQAEGPVGNKQVQNEENQSEKKNLHNVWIARMEDKKEDQLEKKQTQVCVEHVAAKDPSDEHKTQVWTKERMEDQEWRRSSCSSKRLKKLKKGWIVQDSCTFCDECVKAQYICNGCFAVFACREEKCKKLIKFHQVCCKSTFERR